MSDDIMVPPSAKSLFADAGEERALGRKLTARELTERQDEYVKCMTEAIAKGIAGETYVGRMHDSRAPMVAHTSEKRENVVKALEELYETSRMVKSADDSMIKSLGSLNPQVETLSKEWSLTNPISTGLVPYDLEAPAKLLTPRPTPLRNSIPRLHGQGGARRFKVISGFTGTGTGGVTTIQPGVNETTTNSGPGGLNYIRPPYISYAGYDVAVNYVSWGLSDSVSWQAEYQGQGYEDIRSLSNTALLYSTMLLDERLMLFGRGTTAGGYTGALGTPTIKSTTAVSASLAPNSPAGFATTSTVWVLVAADAGDILGTNGYTMHQGPVTTSGTTASVSVSAGQVAQVTIGTDVVGALGYNIFAASIQSGPYFYSGRTGFNVGYVTSQPSAGPIATSGQADQSAVATNFDGLLTNVAASGGYVTRLNAALSTTNPGAEFQTLFASLYDAVKADPDTVLLNGFDRMQLSNAVLNNAANSAYRVYINNGDTEQGGISVGAVVTSMLNEVTGTAIPITVHPWMPQGNALVRSTTLPIPDSNVAETSVMVLPQDYVNIQWPVQQFTYDSSTFEIGTMCHYAPAWNGLLQGIQGVGIGNTPPSYSDA